jgi:hypothetical protein
MIMKKIHLLLFCLVMGCAATGAPARLRAPNTRGGPIDASHVASDAQCMALQDAQDRAMFWAKVLGGIGGAGAIGAVPDAWPDGAQWGIAVGAATSSLMGAALVWYGGVKGDRFKQYCEVTDGQ